MARTLAALFVVVLAACGDNNRPAQPDAGPEPEPARCGNFKLESGEQCDDGELGLDEFCDPQCKLTCGNGTVDATVGELCDTSIAEGTGACPASCDDNQACT